MFMEGNFGPLPYYPFYLDAYRSSRKVQSMGYVQRGFYRELLDECWVRGYIPDDLKELAKICHCPPSRFAQAWPKLSKCFVPLEPGKLISERMSKETLKILQTISNRKKSGTKGGLQRVENIKQRQAFAKTPQAFASSRVEKEYIDKSIYSLKANAQNQQPKTQNQNPYSDPGEACAQCGKPVGFRDNRDPSDAIYVCSPECLVLYERKATSSKTEQG
jgi:uncharacterized protein YdaU (DUF1376 family)